MNQTLKPSVDRARLLGWVERVATFFADHYGLPPITGRNLTHSTVDHPLTKAKAARTWVSPSPSRSSRCTVAASGWKSTPGKGSTFQMDLPTRAELRKSAA